MLQGTEGTASTERARAFRRQGRSGATVQSRHRSGARAAGRGLRRENGRNAAELRCWAAVSSEEAALSQLAAAASGLAQGLPPWAALA